MDKKIQSLFKQYIVKRKNGQCQILIPLIELDDLCSKITNSVKEECIKEIEKEVKEDYKNAFAVAVNKILTKIANAIRDKK